ncbi:hypothetical protein GPECTOR_2g1440 [Gonium pectorale]|uniref:Uncharacterized protein n=1 Tax=Gonium pectorale TaxID=33097 RepID=A0A150H189_GONPE|nr:hypothetical protein GPECTOR_2g1440 [Gonium pectorale]|eukprot:KXZ55889.1 hypothetical protein GPECTOR_2g1440 [Gonium pectorale]
MAGMATRFGPEITALSKPVVVLRGINHGNTSNGEARVARGDITACVTEYGECAKLLASHVSAFLHAHLAPSEEVRSEASSFLLDAVRQSTQRTAPYGVTLGMGDWSAPFAESAPAVGPSGGDVRAGGLVPGSGRSAGVTESIALHPGVVSAAESHAAELQRVVLQSLPEEARSRVTVAATAHTQVESLLYSQPTLTPLPGGRWLLHVHVYMHFRSLESDRGYICPQAPEYWLKLKSADLVAAVLGLPEPSRYATPPPSALNRLALERALAAAPPDVAERYLARGRQLAFEGDV